MFARFASPDDVALCKHCTYSTPCTYTMYDSSISIPAQLSAYVQVLHMWCLLRTFTS